MAGKIPSQISCNRVRSNGGIGHAPSTRAARGLSTDAESLCSQDPGTDTSLQPLGHGRLHPMPARPARHRLIATYVLVTAATAGCGSGAGEPGESAVGSTTVSPAVSSSPSSSPPSPPAPPPPSSPPAPPPALPPFVASA